MSSPPPPKKSQKPARLRAAEQSKQLREQRLIELPGGPRRLCGDHGRWIAGYFSHSPAAKAVCDELLTKEN
jgi:hypothetical protein